MKLFICYRFWSAPCFCTCYRLAVESAVTGNSVAPGVPFLISAWPVAGICFPANDFISIVQLSCAVCHFGAHAKVIRSV